LRCHLLAPRHRLVAQTRRAAQHTIRARSAKACAVLRRCV
jgi:hypothetical protein